MTSNTNDKSNNQDSFAYLAESSLSALQQKGSVVEAQVQKVTAGYVVVNAGLKSDAVIPIAEFAGEEVKEGDTIEVIVESIENGWGETRLSREKAIRARAWILLEKSYASQEIVIGCILERVKGGFTVALEGVRAFLPGSLVDVKPVRDPSFLEGRDLEFKIIKMDQKRNNIVVSRKAVMEQENSEEQVARLSELQEGQEVKGVVKNITDYGAFVDLGGIDGLLHITDMSWKRVKHPSELLNVGDELKVRVLRFDRDKKRVSLGLKQLGDDPWVDIEKRYPLNTRIRGHVTNVTDYGCFVELENGVEGLVHMSEMDWTNKNIHPSKVVSVGQEVDVVVLELDGERRRISLGIKQCHENPWDTFQRQYKKGDVVKGSIRSITDFGIFIGLEGGIDGLVHLSDLSWTKSGEEAMRDYTKGDEVEAIILGVDSERERISLGIKQLESNPVDSFAGDNEGSVEGEVTKVLAKSITLKFDNDVNGILKIADYSHDKQTDLRSIVNVGDKINVKVLGTDPKYGLVVSKKALDVDPVVVMKSSSRDNPPTATTLGDLLKEKMDRSEDKK
jgi:small subunit ribosomal protein S1